jgi:hypothetical protein
MGKNQQFNEHHLHLFLIGPYLRITGFLPYVTKRHIYSTGPYLNSPIHNKESRIWRQNRAIKKTNPVV